MKPFPTIVRSTLLAALCTGCASVPEVESRLQTLQFHPNMYVVQAGDTLETIAFRYRLPPAELAALNPGLGARGELLPSGLRINVRPGTELPEGVRAARPGASPASRSAATGWPEPRPERTVVTRPVPRPAAVTPVPVERGGYGGVPRDEVPDEYLLGEGSGTLPAERAGGVRASEPVAASAVPAVARTGLPGYPREEIVPDDLDAGGDTARTALDGELQRYVGRWSWPTDGAVARGFAPERVGGQGVDIAGLPGQDVRAALDGTVVYSGRDLSGDGNLVIVRHDDGLMTTYSHTDELFVAEDDRVLAGDPIASLGWNDRRESVLRFEVRHEGSPLDPMAFLPAR